MVEYNGYLLDLVSIDRFEREAVMSPDGVDYMYNQYTIQLTMAYHYAYINTGAGPVETDKVLREKLMQPRKKLRVIIVDGGKSGVSTSVATMPAFQEVQNQAGAGNPFIVNGPIPSELGGQNTDIPDQLVSGTAQDEDEEILLESPRGNLPVDAHNGPQPLFCHITKFLGSNGFIVTWSVRTWLNDCFNATLSPMVSNRFVQVHDVNADQLTTITTYGEAVFQTDLLAQNKAVPDDFRASMMAPIFKRFRRDYIQAKQLSDSTVSYLCKDVETPVVFNGEAAGFPAGAIRCEVQHKRLLYQKETLEGSAMNAVRSYYDFKAQKNFADMDAEADKRIAAEERQIQKRQARAMTRLAKSNMRLARAMNKKNP